MKKSRKVVVWILGICAIFCAGAILGSIKAAADIYTVIVLGSTALIGFGMWFYHGHESKEVYEEDNQGAQEEQKD